jgi:hypothetical protein
MLKLSPSFDSVRFTIVGAGAGATSRHGSDQKIRLLAAPAPQH